MVYSHLAPEHLKKAVRRLKDFNCMRLEKYDIVAIVIDSKTFAKERIVIEVGITISGKKILLGFVKTTTKNALD